MRVLPALVATTAVIVTACGGSGSTGPAPGGQSPTLTITFATPIVSGTSIQASATITDASGHTSPASGVTWSSSEQSVASIDGSGLITGRLVGVAKITATSGGITGEKSVSVRPGAPASVYIYSGDGQSGNRGGQLPDPLCVLVKDAAGNTVPNVMASYEVTTGGGTLGQPTSPSTNTSGIAISGLWSLGLAAGQQTVVTSVPGAGSVTFKATAR